MSETRRRVALYVTGVGVAAALLFAGFGITVPPEAGTRLSGASLVAALGDFDQALAICETVLEEHPDSVDARVYRATFLAKAERYEEALVAYDDALAHAEKSSELSRNLRADRASVLLSMGRNKEFAAAREELARERLDASVHLLDAVAAIKRKDEAGAEAALRRVLAEDPANASATGMLVVLLRRRGEAALAERDFATSLKALQEARGLAPQDIELGFLAAEVHLALGQEIAAMRVLEEIGLRERGAAPLAFRAATALLERGRKELALEALAAAWKADARAAEALYKKHPAWASHSETTTLEEIVSSRNTPTGARLTAKGRVIGSGGTQGR